MATQFICEFEFPKHVQQFQRECLLMLTKSAPYRRAVVEVPVRHGKSFWFSYIFPIWYLITHPGRDVIITAHTAELASDFVSRIRTFFWDFGRYVGRTLDPNKQTCTHLRIIGVGKPSNLYGIGREGSIAGRGCSLLIADDLIRTQAEAASETVRKNIFTWWMAEAITRLEPDGVAVVVMSRRHPDDLSGSLLNQNSYLPPSQQWRRIRFPAIDDQGNALWPERFSIERLEAIKREFELSGRSYLFDSLYQQNPRSDPSACLWPDEYLPESMLYEKLPNQDYRFRIIAVDPSCGKTDTSDYVAILVCYIDYDGVIWVEDAIIDRIPLPQIPMSIKLKMQKHSPHGIIMEANGFAAKLADDVVTLCDMDGTLCPMWKYNSTENKTVRCNVDLSPLLAQHRIRIRNSMGGKLLLNQLREFPSGAYDDGVDALSLATQLINKMLMEKPNA
jgi:predicted phage terminase large subunit-like protein